MEPAKTVAKTFVELMGINDNTAIISFSDKARVDYNFTKISQAEDKIPIMSPLRQLFLLHF